MAVAVNAVVIEEGDITGEGRKLVLIEETKTVSDAIKISEVVVKFRVTRLVRVGNAAVVEGTIEKQIFFINTAGVKSHLSETLSFGDTVDVVPIDPSQPVTGPFQNRSVLEDVVVRFDPETHALTQKIAILINVIAGGVTGDPPLQTIAATPTGLGAEGSARPQVKATQPSASGLPKEIKVEIGTGQTRFLLEREITLDAFEVTNITVEPIDDDPNIGRVVEGKVIVQATLEKEITFLDREFESQTITERVPFSVLVEIVPNDSNDPARPGMQSLTDVSAESIFFEFNSATSVLLQKIVVVVTVQVTVIRRVYPE
ncbi:MAG: hypothetical protein GX338_07055 [Firmicutes bacterium]|jgi:hypothetical protein|nr:hypothetical protein [Bacillota bacterium]